MFAFACWAGWPSPAHAETALNEPQPGPAPIVNGQEAGTCAWPSVVAVHTNIGLCSGTLVHPNVVITAAHCRTDEGPVTFAFGEEDASGDPARTVEALRCTSHPGYDDGGFYPDDNPDFAVCVLASPVTDVPIVPILGGCEVDQLTKGSKVVIVGFGAENAYFDENGNLVGSGVGPKRWTDQTVFDLDKSIGWVDVEGDHMNSSCPGDSGGPMFIRLASGEWRLAGVSSSIRYPSLEPGENICGYLATYGFPIPHLEWFESASGYDLTPCFDSSGNVDPAGNCGGFPLEPNVGYGTWANGCAGGPKVDNSGICVQDGSAPAIAVLQPADGARFDLKTDGGQPTVEIDIIGEAIDSGSGIESVELRIDGQSVQTLLAPPFAWRPRLPGGVFAIELVATDRAGNVASDAIEVGVGEPAPADDGSESGTGGDPDGVEDDDADTDPQAFPGTGIDLPRGPQDCRCRTSPQPVWSTWALMGLVCFAGRRRRPIVR